MATCRGEHPWCHYRRLYDRFSQEFGCWSLSSRALWRGTSLVSNQVTLTVNAARRCSRDFRLPAGGCDGRGRAKYDFHGGSERHHAGHISVAKGQHRPARRHWRHSNPGCRASIRCWYVSAAGDQRGWHGYLQRRRAHRKCSGADHLYRGPSEQSFDFGYADRQGDDDHGHCPWWLWHKRDQADPGAGGWSLAEPLWDHRFFAESHTEP
jgi:hypothetical protein